MRTMAHEFGHLLGLTHPNCPISDTVMGTQVAAGTPPSELCKTTNGLALLPTDSDILATKNSTYGNGVVKACGF
jgi:hypothetical protein